MKMVPKISKVQVYGEDQTVFEPMAARCTTTTTIPLSSSSTF